MGGLKEGEEAPQLSNSPKSSLSLPRRFESTCRDKNSETFAAAQTHLPLVQHSVPLRTDRMFSHFHRSGRHSPSDEKESAIIATLTPGAYTAIVRGAGNSSGVALVEVYALSQ